MTQFLPQPWVNSTIMNRSRFVQQEKVHLTDWNTAGETVVNQAEARYHRISHDPKEIEKLLVKLFLESYRKPPRSIVIDLDVTDDTVHGNQEQAFFNTYYGGVCYAPLYIFCGHHLLAAKLRPSNVDPALGALEEMSASDWTDSRAMGTNPEPRFVAIALTPVMRL